MNKLMLLTAGAVGYVLGTKAGRQRYDQLRDAAQKVKDDPRVQEKAHQAADLARDKAPLVSEKLAEAAHRVKPGGDSTSDRASDSSSTNGTPATAGTSSTAGPQGPLP